MNSCLSLSQDLGLLFDDLLAQRPRYPLQWLAASSDGRRTQESVSYLYQDSVILSGMKQVERYMNDKKIDTILLNLLDAALSDTPSDFDQFARDWANSQLEIEANASLESFSESEDLEESLSTFNYTSTGSSFSVDSDDMEPSRQDRPPKTIQQSRHQDPLQM